MDKYLYLIALLGIFLYMPAVLISDIFVTPLFLLLPTGVGYLLSSLLMKETTPILNVITLFSYWSIGVLSAFAFFIILSNVGVMLFGWNFHLFSVILLAVSLSPFSLIISRLKIAEFPQKIREIVKRVKGEDLTIIVALSIISTYSTLFPCTNMFSYQFRNLLNSWIISDSIKFVNNYPFDYYGGSPPLAAFLAAILSSLAQKHPIHIYCYLGYFTSFILSFTVYFSLKETRVLRGKMTCLLATFLFTWSATSNVLDDAFSTGSLTFLFYPLVAVFFIKNVITQKISVTHRLRKLLATGVLTLLIVLSVLFSGTILSLHRNLILLISVIAAIILTFLTRDVVYVIVTSFVFMNPLTSLILLMPILLLWFVYPILYKVGTKLLYLLIIFSIFLLYGLYYNILFIPRYDFIGNLLHLTARAVGWAAYTPNQKAQYLFKNGPDLLVHFSLVGLLLTALSSMGIEPTYSFCLLAALNLITLLSPEAFVYRALYGIGFFISLFSATLIERTYDICMCLSHKLKSPKKHKEIMKYLLMWSIIFLNIFSSLFLAYHTVNSSIRKNWHLYITKITPEKTHSFYMSSEILAAEWIYFNTVLKRPKYPFFDIYTPENETLFNNIIVKNPVGLRDKIIRFSKANDTLLISDPFTMASLNVFTLRDILMPEVVFIYEQEYSLYALSFLDKLKEAFKSKTPQDFISSIDQLKRELYRDASKETYIIISKRTLNWLYTNKTFITNVREINEWRTVGKIFEDSRFFELVYVIPEEIYIYKIKKTLT
ncbi:MAG: AzlD domain-containing protein [Thermoproteota archaeon]